MAAGATLIHHTDAGAPSEVQFDRSGKFGGAGKGKGLLNTADQSVN